jgi:hypothetical protein
MMTFNGPSRRLDLTCLLAFALATLPVTASAQSPAPDRAKPGMVKTTGVWVEGPGYDIKYGGTYEQCSERCLTTSACMMIEYYKPEKKCNMYNTERALKTGGDSIVGTKTPAKP